MKSSNELRVVAPFFISQCYNRKEEIHKMRMVVAPFFISQCYNLSISLMVATAVVAPFFISQCYNRKMNQGQYDASCSSLFHFAVL